jgi:hypothetical protein
MDVPEDEMASPIAETARVCVTQWKHINSWTQVNSRISAALTIQHMQGGAVAR